ncbi:hypothetical protein [Ramlibacter ginsenosidimutans]
MIEPHDLLLPADVAPVLLTMAGADALHGDLPPQEPPREPQEKPREDLLEERPEEGLHEAAEGRAEEPAHEPMEERADAPEQGEQREPVQDAAQDALMQEAMQGAVQEAMQESAQEAPGDADAEAVEVGFRKVFRAVQRALQMASYLPAEPPGLTRVAVVSGQGRLIASAALDSPSQARFLLDQLQALGFEERSSTEEIQKLGCDLLVVHTANLEVGEVQGIVKGLKGERWPPEG